VTGPGRVTPPVLSPVRMKLARIVLGLGQRQAGERWSISPKAISRHECGDQPLGVKTQRRILEQLRGDQVFFGPGVSVCFGEDLFTSTQGEKK